jgi:hypothetical protein
MANFLYETFLKIKTWYVYMSKCYNISGKKFTNIQALGLIKFYKKAYVVNEILKFEPWIVLRCSL